MSPDTIRRAMLVMGAESTGTRFVTQLLINNGCQGDYTHTQCFDKTELAGAGPLIVWRRSFPRGVDPSLDLRVWPDVPGSGLCAVRRGHRQRSMGYSLLAGPARPRLQYGACQREQPEGV